MKKRDYKAVAIRLYYEDIGSYIELYDGVRRLVSCGLLGDEWSTYVWEIDNKLYAGELRRDK